MSSGTASVLAAQSNDRAATRSRSGKMEFAAHPGALRMALAAVLVQLSTSATSAPRPAFAPLRAVGLVPQRRATVSRGPSMGRIGSSGEIFEKRPRKGSTDRVKNFLTQRSVQTQLFTLSCSGDLNTFEFLECFKDHHGPPPPPISEFSKLRASFRTCAIPNKRVAPVALPCPLWLSGPRDGALRGGASIRRVACCSREATVAVTRKHPWLHKMSMVGCFRRDGRIAP